MRSRTLFSTAVAFLALACAPPPSSRGPAPSDSTVEPLPVAPRTAPQPAGLASSALTPLPGTRSGSSPTGDTALDVFDGAPAARPSACDARSRTARHARDRVDAVPTCEALGPIVGGTDPRGCATVAPEGGLARLEEAIPVIDPSTRERIDAIARRGRAAGRNARAFGLVGDSITEGQLFLGPFAAGSTQPVEIDPAVAATLRTTLEGRDASIVEVYRGVVVEQLAGFARDSFRAQRAAKVGAPSGWALARGEGGVTPLAAMIDRVNPAVAIVMYGSNDAAVGLVPMGELVARFEANLRRIVRELDEAGIVPILSTIPRRGPQPGLRDCAADGLSDARIMVQTNALSAAAARVACEERLPLIDLRHAFDGLVSAGLFHDGIHPTSHPRGSGLLTGAGLGCGYNARNYLALGAFRNVRNSLLDGAWR